MNRTSKLVLAALVTASLLGTGVPAQASRNHQKKACELVAVALTMSPGSEGLYRVEGHAWYEASKPRLAHLIFRAIGANLHHNAENEMQALARANSICARLLVKS
jgi:lysophospholipase L1-like esterase